MPEVVFPGVEGQRIEGFYSHNKKAGAPLAVIMHAAHGGKSRAHMNALVPYNMFYAFKRCGFSVLRINFRGTGKSEGSFGNGLGELFDATSALDFIQYLNPGSSECWICGMSFGAWVGMQLLMRRPEVHSFITISPPTNLYDFSFLAPCPASGMVVYGANDRLTPPEDMLRFQRDMKKQKEADIDFHMVEGANHFFDSEENSIKNLVHAVESYLTKNSSRKVTAPIPMKKRTRTRASA